jgi:ribosomal protein S21
MKWTQILVQNSEVERPLERFKHRCEDNIKLGLDEVG